MKRALYFCLLLSLSSCDNENLGNNYYYLPDNEALAVGYPYGSVIYKSNKKNVFQKIIIPANVIKCDVDADHILVVQKPDKQLIEKQIKEDNGFIGSAVLRNVFRSDTNYYIIDKFKETVDGPMSKAEFDDKKRKF
jgi:hypothetical protein